MKPAIHDRLVRAGASRRELLKTVSGLGAMAALGAFGTPLRSAFAQGDLRAAILKIPGVGKGSPTDADWQKVGELCLGADQGRTSRKASSPASSSPSWGSTTRTCTTSCSAAS